MTRDVGLEAFLILFSCGFVPFLSRLGFFSWNKILQVADLHKVVNKRKCRNALTTSNHQNATVAEENLQKGKEEYKARLKAMVERVNIK